jgi:hypothetical protein
MKRRLPAVLSVTALVIALAGVTPLGEAASDAIPRFCPKRRQGGRDSRVADAEGGPTARPQLEQEVPRVRPTDFRAERPRNHLERERDGFLHPEARDRELPDRQACGPRGSASERLRSE